MESKKGGDSTEEGYPSGTVEGDRSRVVLGKKNDGWTSEEGGMREGGQAGRQRGLMLDIQENREDGKTERERDEEEEGKRDVLRN